MKLNAEWGRRVCAQCMYVNAVHATCLNTTHSACILSSFGTDGNITSCTKSTRQQIVTSGLVWAAGTWCLTRATLTSGLARTLGLAWRELLAPFPYPNLKWTTTTTFEG